MKRDYSDIIHLSRPVSKKHAPMAIEDRAAQFAPFAALTGFGAVIRSSETEFVAAADRQQTEAIDDI